MARVCPFPSATRCQGEVAQALCSGGDESLGEHVDEPRHVVRVEQGLGVFEAVVNEPAGREAAGLGFGRESADPGTSNLGVHVSHHGQRHIAQGRVL